MLKRLFDPTNRKIRLCVGLLLAALFCIQCTQVDAFRESEYITVSDGKVSGKNAESVLATVERLAKTDHIALLEFCLAHYEKTYRDYTCTLIKQERVAGRLGKEQQIAAKFMEPPFSVAMAWTPESAPMGDRLVYVEGRDENKMRVRPTSTLLRRLAGGSVLREPNGREAMRYTLRPVNLFGFRRAMGSLLDVYRQAKKAGDLRETYGGHAKVAGREAVILHRYLPAKDNYPAQKTSVFIDLEYLVPTCVEGYDWDGKISCVYLYKDLKFNVGLTDEDFLPEANDIAKPK